jgi:hypothetical protein
LACDTTLHATRIGGKELAVAKDAEKTPAARLNQIRREWGLDTVDEATAQAQNKALEPLQEWLKTGVDSPEVVVRSVQVLLANPETPGVEKRRSVSEVVEQVSTIWARAGVGSQGLLGLQAMLMAAWPYDETNGGFELVPMLDSAWSTRRGGERYQPLINEWRKAVCQPSETPPQDLKATAAANVPVPALPALETLKAETQMLHLRQHVGVQWTYNAFANQLVGVLDAHNADLKNLSNYLTTLPNTLGGITKSINAVASQLKNQVNDALERHRSEAQLLWWGQARYSRRLHNPYRRITNPDERLWWMAWEASELAVGLEVEPAASFLVESMLQLGDDVDHKLPLKQWLQSLMSVLRRSEWRHGLANQLEELAKADCLGLPVTWARLQTENAEEPGALIENVAREALGMDLDAEIDRGEWASWVFREALLDWHLEED